MRKELGLLVLLSVVFIGLSFVLSSEANAGPPKEIVIHHIGDLTGPYASFTGVSALHAMKDMETIINNRGGVKGVKVRIVMSDTRNKRDLALSHYARIAPEKPPIIVLQQGADAEILKERLAEDKIPAIGTYPTPKNVWPAGWVFQSIPEITDLFAHFVDWLRSDWKKSGKIRLAFIARDDTVGRALFTPEVEKYMKKKGIEVVAREFFPPQDLDITTQMARIAAQKPEVVFVVAIGGSQNRVVFKAAEAVGLTGGKVLFGNGIWGLDRGAAKMAEGLMEGVVGSQSFWVPGDTNVPIVKELLEIFSKEKRPPEQLTAAYCVLAAINAMAAEVLTKTVERVGWDKFSGEEVYKTLKESKNLHAMGFMPLKFAPGKVCPSLSRMVKMKNGEPVAITGFTACPDMRPAQYR